MTTRNQNVPAAFLLPMIDNKVLLQRRFNAKYENGNYSLVAGHVEAGESFKQCIIRETFEEIGIKIDPKDLEIAHIMHRHSPHSEYPEYVDIYFITRNWTGEIKIMEPEKCDDLSWFEINSLPTNIVPHIKHAIECIDQKILYSEFGW